jgi:outer membrane protein assembly factor BamA
MHSLRLANIFGTRLLSLCLVALCPAIPYSRAAAQAAPAPKIPAGSKLIEIKVNGSSRFTQQEIVTACGLPVGTIAGDDDFRKAARQLGETGAFSEISYTFSFTSAGTKLIFQVADAEKFVPAHFADFVWFTDQNLHEKLHEHIPLFDGELPTSGRLIDQVSDVLQAMLVENGIPGHVEYMRSNDANGKVDAVDYTVANIVIRIHHVDFPGASGDELKELESAASKLEGRDYYRALLHDFVDRTVLSVYHERGYLKAACAPPQPKVFKVAAPDVIDEKTPITLVDVALAVTPGAKYTLKGWDWSGNKNIPTAQLQPLLYMKIGQPADTVQLTNDLRIVQQLYGSRGYVTSTIKAQAQYDDAASTVSYVLAVNEGDVYHMGELEFRGIDNNLTARLRGIWKLRTGDVYDSNYLKEFLPQARKLLPPTMDWDVSSHVTAVAKEKVVDVDLIYTAKAPQ